MYHPWISFDIDLHLQKPADYAATGWVESTTGFDVLERIDINMNTASDSEASVCSVDGLFSCWNAPLSNTSGIRQPGRWQNVAPSFVQSVTPAADPWIYVDLQA